MVNFDRLLGLDSFWWQCSSCTAIHSQVSHFNLVSRKDHTHSPLVFWGQQQCASFNCEFVCESIEERSYTWEEELWMSWCFVWRVLMSGELDRMQQSTVDGGGWGRRWGCWEM
jgi:hypothetical protein